MDEAAIHIWLCRNDNTLLSLDHLSVSEKAQTLLMSEKRRQEWVLSRTLLRACLRQYAPHVSKKSIQTYSSGKPYIENAPAFSVSHSRKWVGCALSVGAHALGFDIETTQRKNNITAIYEHYFSEDEIEKLNKMGDVQEKRHLFFKLWTLKEAYIKAIGSTISAEWLYKAIFTDEGTAIKANFPISDNWQFYHHTIDEHFHIAIASEWSTPIDIDYQLLEVNTADIITADS